MDSGLAIICVLSLFLILFLAYAVFAEAAIWLSVASAFLESVVPALLGAIAGRR